MLIMFIFSIRSLEMKKSLPCVSPLVAPLIAVGWKAGQMELGTWPAEHRPLHKPVTPKQCTSVHNETSYTWIMYKCTQWNWIRLNNVQVYTMKLVKPQQCSSVTMKLVTPEQCTSVHNESRYTWAVYKCKKWNWLHMKIVHVYTMRPFTPEQCTSGLHLNYVQL